MRRDNMDQEIRHEFNMVHENMREVKTDLKKGYDKLDRKLDQFLLRQNINDKEIAIIQVTQETHGKDIQSAHDKIKVTDSTVSMLRNQLNKAVFKVGAVITVIAGVIGIILKWVG